MAFFNTGKSVKISPNTTAGTTSNNTLSTSGLGGLSSLSPGVVGIYNNTSTTGVMDYMSQLQQLQNIGIRNAVGQFRMPGAVTEAQPKVALPIPEKSVAVLEQITPYEIPADKREYMEIAAKAGAVGVVDQLKGEYEREKAKTDAAERRNEFRSFLSENGICVYESVKVNAYMTSITPSGYCWVWKYAAGPMIDKVSSRYSQPIPLPVLMTMTKIREKYPEATFEVTEIVQQPKLDPFLRVSITRPMRDGKYSVTESNQEFAASMQFASYMNGSTFSYTGIPTQDYFIIERWDEPGFRM